MCTATCPCDGSSKSQFEASLTQVRLTEHGRSKSSTTQTADLKPFVWSNDASNSYKNFESCYKNKLQKDSKTDLGSLVKNYIKQKEAKGTVLTNFVEKFWKYGPSEWSLIEKFEDEHNCAGFCRPSLFYFSKDLSEGAPKETCLKEIIKNVKAGAGSIGSASALAGTVALFNMLMSLFLVNRHYTADENWQPGFQAGESAMDSLKRMNGYESDKLPQQSFDSYAQKDNMAERAEVDHNDIQLAEVRGNQLRKIDDMEDKADSSL